MINTNTFTNLENIDLSKEISLVAPLDTPFYTLLLGNKLQDTTTSKITTWREKTLDNTEDITVTEGSETDVFQSSARAEKNNICEIFKKAVSVSGTANASGIAGVPNLFAEEVNDRLVEMKVNIEKKLITGVRDDGSASPYIRKMDGMLSFALPEQTITNATVTEAKFKDTVRKLWDAGLSTGEYIGMCNADLKEEIDKIYDAKYSYVAQEEMFGLVVRKIQTNYGNVNLILNRHMPIDQLVVFNPAFFKVSYLRKPFFEMLAKTGDSVKGHVISELTLKCFNPKAMAVFTKKA